MELPLNIDEAETLAGNIAERFFELWPADMQSNERLAQVMATALGAALRDCFDAYGLTRAED
jgi:hypothetical protein